MSVYTLITQPELEEFLCTYDLGELISFEGISAGIENTNYFVDTTAGRFVLTIFEHHTVEELAYFMEIMAFMAHHDIPAAQPAKTRNGLYVTLLKGKPASLVARLTGSGVEQPTLAQCKVMGEQLARFHAASATFQGFRANDRDLAWMQHTFQTLSAQLANDDIELITQELAFQSGYDFSTLPQGVIHADLFCDNALFEDDKLTGIIDLYYACNGAFLYDIAVMVNEWARLPSHQLDAEKMAVILMAYQQIRPFTQLENDYWQAALRLGALRFFLSRLKDKVMPREGELTQIKNPLVFKALLAYHNQPK